MIHLDFPAAVRAPLDAAARAAHCRQPRTSAAAHRSRSPIAACNSAAIWRASRRSKQVPSSARSSSICCSIDILTSSILRKMKASPGVEWTGQGPRSGGAGKIGGTIVLEVTRSAPVSWAELSGFLPLHSRHPQRPLSHQDEFAERDRGYCEPLVVPDSVTNNVLAPGVWTFEESV